MSKTIKRTELESPRPEDPRGSVGGAPLRGTRRQLKRKLLTTLKLVGIHSNTQFPPPKPHNEPLDALEEKERSNRRRRNCPSRSLLTTKMSESDSNIKPQDIQLPLSSPESPTSARSRANRPASIGDASQLFGGGSGSDDFFGPPSTFSNDLAQQASLFDPVPEEPANTNAFDHDPFAWPSAHQTTTLTQNAHQQPSLIHNDPSHVSDAGIPASYDNPAGFPSDYPNPYQPNPAPPEPLSYHQDHHQPPNQNMYSSPNLNFDSPRFNDPARFASPVSSYPQSVHQTSTGLGISNSSFQAPYAQQQQQQQQPASDDYNPYAPADIQPTPQNPYSSYVPQQPSAFNPPNPHLADLIPRSVSVNALSPSDPAHQVPGQPNFQRPRLVQSATHHHTTSPLNRPKVYDAYDPPAIRKKKPYAFNTASLPASPALGGDGFPGQTPMSGLASYQPHPASFTPPPPPPPPPPPKQRSTSTPAHTYDPMQMSSTGFNDFYAQPPHIHNPQRQFATPSYSNHQASSSPLSQQPTSFDGDPYLSTSSTDFAPPSQQHVMPNSNIDSQYQDPSRQADMYQYGQPIQTPSQSSSMLYMPTSHSEDPYAPAHSTQVVNNRSDHIPLASPPAPANASEAPPSNHYMGQRSTSQQPVPFHAVDQAPPPPPSINIYGSQEYPHTYASITSGMQNSKQKSGSPLKMSVVPSVPEDVDGQQQSGFNHYQNPEYSSVPPEDPLDALSSATQKLSITKESTGPDSLNPEFSRSNADFTPQTPPSSLGKTTNAHPEGSFNTPEKQILVPDVQIQPATPQIPIPGTSDTAPAAPFDDVLADVATTTHSQPLDAPKNTEAILLDDFYGAPNHYSTEFQYSAEYNYDAVPNNMQAIHPLDNSQASHTNQPSDSSVIYNPYTAPFEPHSSASPATLNGHDSSQPIDFTASDSQTPYQHQADYTLMGEASAYGSMNDHTQQSPYGLQPESFTSDQSMAARDHAATDWPHDSASEGQAITGASAYNPYDPMSQSQADFTGWHVAEDPMAERLTGRIPVASFGFGGKLITVFPTIMGGGMVVNGGGQATTGFEDPYGSGGMMFHQAGAHAGTTVQMQQLSHLIPISDLQAFPGPLFMDGGSKSSLGKKRKEVVAWLDAKLDEALKESVFIQSTLAPRPPNQHHDVNDAKVDNLQDKIILMKLLKLLVENEGKLSGTSKVDEAVRLVLQSMDSQPASVEAPSALSGLSQPDTHPQDIIASYHTRASHLDSIQALLSNGDRQKAVHVAVEQRMWPHALIIANSLGHDIWRETVKEFVRFEMGDGDMSLLGHGSLGSAPPSPPKGREALRTLYTLFAGAGPAAVDEFSLSVAHAPSSPAHFESHAMSATHTGMGSSQLGSSRAPSPAPLMHPMRSSPAKIPNNVLHQWRSVVAMTISNRVPGSAPFLIRLGDTLLNNGRTYAAHTTYLLSNGVMPQLTLDNGNRISLLGSPAGSNPDGPGLDLEAVMLSEVLEFALSLSPVPKNVEPFIGVPHLQAYRLALGLEYATFGLVDRANKYCEALAATLKLATKPCPFYHPFLLEQVKTLSSRLSAAPLAEKGSSWITRKMPRPTLDNVWQTLEGRVHKFVAGDDDDDGSKPAASNATGSSSQNNQVLGPFSHYSSISPESVSGTVSRVQSSNDLSQTSTPTASGLAGPFHHNANLQRPSSGAGYSPSYYSKDPRRASPSNQYEVSSLSPVDYAPFRGQTSSVPPLNSYEQAATVAGSPANVSSPGETVTGENGAAASSGGGWWEASNSYGTPANNTSQPIFQSITDTPIAEDVSGFIDPMATFGAGPIFASPGPSVMPSNPSFDPSPSSRTQYDDDDVDPEDLGFGNSSSRKQNRRGSAAADTNNGPSESPSSHSNTDNHDAKSAETEPENKSVKNAASSSWLSKWFKRDSGGQAASGSGPVKANLGENFSLVYDPETKRWVNKKAGASQGPSPAGAPPPPPARAQTASPTSSMRAALGPPTTAGSPGAARAVSGGVPPPPAMSRSTTMGLQHTATASLDNPPSPALPDLPSALPSSLANTPPPPSSVAGKKPNPKKNIRSRYVEIR
ncbi:hypothetical protein PCANC_01350 [Puccinia coronata f. sp. avenae]|uniref:Protein transport protein sec16 n=1 Tax=Puccinia coronata f. sp. avenae TaxID=200324 RepID=A0A2N5W636_9BASI|nr:hypothetical protein PCANC_01350 [Puccinia coronata f. sp. avenae]